MLDARYEKIREGGVIRAEAVLIAISINLEGLRQPPAPTRMYLTSLGRLNHAQKI